MNSPRIGTLRFSLLLAGVFGVGFLCLVLYQRQSMDGMDVVFEPSDIEVPELVSEGEAVQTDIVLVNGMNSPVMLEFIQGSCGCLELSTEEGVVLQGPLKLERGQRLPVRVTLATQGISGQRTYTVKALGSLMSDERPFRTEARITVHVAGGLRADPGRITLYDVLPGEEATAEVRILDGRPWPGIALKEVRFSNPDAMHGTLRRLPFEKNPSHLYQSFAARYHFSLSYQVPTSEESGEETIGFVPKDENQPILTVPVTWFCKPPKYDLSPRLLVLDAAASTGVVHRRVRCTVDDTVKDELLRVAVLEKPEHFQIQLVHSEPGTMDIEIGIDMDNVVTAGDAQIAFGDPETRQQAFVLLVRLTGIPNGQRDD